MQIGLIDLCECIKSRTPCLHQILNLIIQFKSTKRGSFLLTQYLSIINLLKIRA